MNRLREFVALAAPAVAVMVATAYISGFIIVNTFLGQFGLFSDELLKSRYIAAGGLFLSVTGAFAFLVLRPLRGMNDVHKMLRTFGQSEDSQSTAWKTFAFFFPQLE